MSTNDGINNSLSGQTGTGQYAGDTDPVFTNNIDVAGNIRHDGDTNNFIGFGTDTQDFQTGGSSRLDISDSGVRLGAANARVTTILDEDDMSSDSATALITQQSAKAYTDAQNNISFRASMSATQTIPSGFASGLGYKVEFDTENWDTNGDYDPTTNYRHTPSVAGKYHYTASLIYSGITDQTRTDLRLVKNGASAVAQVTQNQSGTGVVLKNLSHTEDMNGTTDYMEVYAVQEEGTDQDIGTTNSYFTGFFVET